MGICNAFIAGELPEAIRHKERLARIFCTDGGIGTGVGDIEGKVFRRCPKVAVTLAIVWVLTPEAGIPAGETMAIDI